LYLDLTPLFSPPASPRVHPSELHRLIQGLLTSVLLTGIITNITKVGQKRQEHHPPLQPALHPHPSSPPPPTRSPPKQVAVHRPRPNFFARCWPDFALAWSKEDAYGGYPKCGGDAKAVAEGLKSFPSGGWRARPLMEMAGRLEPLNAREAWQQATDSRSSL
jgi:hypothetical protein